jgi:hypothetical protein
VPFENLTLPKLKTPVSPTDLAQLIAGAQVALAKRLAQEKKILEWGKLLFPDKFPLPFCHELHNYFVEIRDVELSDTEAPRSHAKTTIKCFLIPIFTALEEPEKYRHYLNVQATGSKAMEINRSIKHEIETNPLIFAIYGNLIGARWTDQQFVIAHHGPSGRIMHEVAFTSVGAGQSIRGINYRNIRPDYIVVDDLYDEEDINNPDSTLKKNDWFWGSLYPARSRSRKCSFHVQGTAINDEDILEKLKKMTGCISRTFRAIKETGEILWKELNTRQKLDEERQRMGSVIFEREMQNVRRNDATSIIKKAWMDLYDPEELFKRIKDDPNHFMIRSVKLLIDPSIGKNSENDFTGIALMYETCYSDAQGGSDYWIEKVWNEHLSLDARILKLIHISQGQPKDLTISECRIESISGFQDFTQEVIRRTNLPVHAVEKVPDKITNLENKSHFFENKKVHLNKFMDPVLLDVAIYQLTTNHPKHDDVRDAILLGLDSQSGLWRFVE